MCRMTIARRISSSSWLLTGSVVKSFVMKSLTSIVQLREAFVIPPQIFRASHSRPYEALFWKLMMKATAVPINATGSHGRCNHLSPNTL